MKHLIVLVILSISSINAQNFKIDNVTLPDSLGIEYLKYCNTNLDTLVYTDYVMSDQDYVIFECYDWQPDYIDPKTGKAHTNHNFVVKYKPHMEHLLLWLAENKKWKY